MSEAKREVVYSPPMITLPVFIAKQRSLLDDFWHEWMRNHVNNPKDWPLDLTVADWQEQFNTYINDK